MKLVKFPTFFISFFCSFAVSVNAQSPKEYSLQFQASANSISATANRSLARDSVDTFLLTNALEAKLGTQLIARIEQTATLQFTDTRIRPLSYSYLQTGLSQETQAVNYNWDAMLALSAEDDESWSIDLSSASYDQLSHQFALRQALFSGSNDLSFAVIDEDEIENYRYRLIDKEIVATPLGNFNSTKVERIRDEDDDRTTVFWLADDWDYVLIRMEQRNSGLTILLELNGGTLAGEEIRALD